MKYVGFVPSGAWYVSDTNIQADLFICERRWGAPCFEFHIALISFFVQSPYT